MHFPVLQAANASPKEIALRCPACRQNGVFVPLAGRQDTMISPEAIIASRRCPNAGCKAAVFVVYSPAPAPDGNANVLVSYPAERLDFDPSEIPDGVVKAFEEALTCHANHAPMAVAIMVRKTLEELCADQGATGDNLFSRLQDLESKIVVPQALLDAAQELRLLGNDAAHLEAQAFNQVTEAEVEAGIALTKELLKAVYQMGSLLTKLTALKRQ